MNKIINNNWKYYFPYVFLFVGFMIFISFFWTPDYLTQKHKQHIINEKEYISLLQTTLLPLILSGDLAEIKNNLDRVMTKHGSFESIELFNKNDQRLYPLFIDKDNTYEQSEVFESFIQYDGITYGKLVVTSNIKSLLESDLSEVRKLEVVLTLLFLLFIVIAVYLQKIWITRPIMQIMNATTKLASGEYNEELPKNLSGDLFKFIVSFEKMREILKYRAEKIIFQNEISRTVQEIQQSFFHDAKSSYGIFDKILNNILSLTGSQFGFLAEIKYNDSNQPELHTFAITNISWDVSSRKLYEQSIENSLVFKNLDTLFGNVVVSGKTVISLDPANDPRSGGLPPGHPELHSFMGVPLYNRSNKLMGIAVVANSQIEYTQGLCEELNILWLALGNLIETRLERILLSQSEQRLRAVLNNAVEGIISIDDKGIVETFNPSAEKMFGYFADDVIGKNIKMLMPDKYSSHHDQYLSNYINGGQAKIIGSGREVVGLRKNGTTFPMDLSVSEIVFGSMRKFTGIVRDITERKEKEDEVLLARKELAIANKELEELARTDGLTKVSNRRSLNESLESELNRSLRQDYPLSLLIFDVDYFKKYNDHYGHSSGDECLVQIAKATKELFQRPGEVVSRYGGEEFAVVLPHTAIEAMKKMGEVLLENINQLNIEHVASLTEKHVTISIGGAVFDPQEHKNITDFIKSADKALYVAKNNGRNQISIYDYGSRER